MFFPGTQETAINCIFFPITKELSSPKSRLPPESCPRNFQFIYATRSMGFLEGKTSDFLWEILDNPIAYGIVKWCSGTWFGSIPFLPKAAWEYWLFKTLASYHEEKPWWKTQTRKSSNYNLNHSHKAANQLRINSLRTINPKHAELVVQI